MNELEGVTNAGLINPRQMGKGKAMCASGRQEISDTELDAILGRAVADINDHVHRTIDTTAPLIAIMDAEATELASNEQVGAPSPRSRARSLFDEMVHAHAHAPDAAADHARPESQRELRTRLRRGCGVAVDLATATGGGEVARLATSVAVHLFGLEMTAGTRIRAIDIIHGIDQAAVLYERLRTSHGRSPDTGAEDGPWIVT